MNTTITNKLAAFYFLSGDETLLIQQTRDRICQKAHACGYTERHMLTIESINDWQTLLQYTQNKGLFSEKQLIDVRHLTTKFDKHIQQLLLSYVSNPNPDVIVILSTGKLSSAQRKAKWFKALEPHMQTHFIWPLKAYELAQWIDHRLQQHQLQADRDTIQLLIELTTGNLLATHQAIYKLALLYSNQTIDQRHIIEVIHDSARFSVFDLANYVLAGQTLHALRVIEHIQTSGGEAILVLWALARDIRELYTLIFHYQRGTPIAQLIAKQWSSRKPLLQQAIQRLSLTTLNESLSLCHQTDLMIKGVEPGDPWQQLKSIATMITGAST